ncbi:MAG: sigma-70 family RNA polymerase sigma factor [Chloroflexota bacterium]|nr:sigma-70 family RNA polymerase sigma factor [Chloroflexota bacterium]
MRDVVAEAQAGRAEAFEVLVDHFAPQVYRLASAIVGPDDARDVAQETFIAAWRELPRLRDPDRFEPWLRRILVNRSRNVLRGRQRRPAASLDLLGATDGLSGEPDFREAAHARQALDGAFAGLSADQRAVIALHYGADLSIRDAAKSMGVAVGTAKSRLNAALRRLRVAVEGQR